MIVANSNQKDTIETEQINYASEIEELKQRKNEMQISDLIKQALKQRIGRGNPHTA